MKKVKKGFTLIELIVVIAILGILAAVLIPKFTNFTQKARVKSAKSDAKNIQTSVEAYFAEHGKYTTNIADLKDVEALINGKDPKPALKLEAEGVITYETKTEPNYKVTVDKNGVMTVFEGTKQVDPEKPGSPS